MSEKSLMIPVEDVLLDCANISAMNGIDNIDIEMFFHVMFMDKDIKSILIEKVGKDNVKKAINHISNKLESRVTEYSNVNPRLSYDLEKYIKQSMAVASFENSTNSKNIELDVLLDQLKDQNTNLKDFLYVTDTNSNKSTKIDETGTSPAFQKYCENMNVSVSENGHIKLIGRDKELSDIERGLKRKKKNSIIITSEPGIGKTTLVEGLVTRILNDEVSEHLKNKIVYRLNTIKLNSGVKYHGILEERLDSILETLKNNPNIILFIDEMHTIKSSIPNEGSIIVDFIKTAVTESNVKIIGCTTNAEYRKNLQNDGAFTRRFNHIKLSEPNVQETLQICSGISSTYEEYYGFEIPVNVWEKTIYLTDKYAKNRMNPDKSLDLMDSALARVVLEGRNEINEEDIGREVSYMYNIPIPNIQETSYDNLQRIEKELNNNIYGQQDAIKAVMSGLFVSQSGLRSNDKTMLSLLFQGPTSTGKTETAKIIAQSMGIPLKRYDLSAYYDTFSISSLIGSPPGYIGYNDGNSGSGKLINDIENDPHCVLLMDEVEKAHPKVLDILLQIMDYGSLTSSSGKQVHFDNVILIMTTNLGSQSAQKESIGFMQPKNDKKDKIDQDVKSFLRPEFRARLDGIVHYNDLNEEVLEMIIDKQINEINDKLKSSRIKINLTSKAKHFIVSEAKKSSLGARNIQTIMNMEIKSSLAKYVVKEGKDFSLDVDYENEFKFNKI